MRGQRGQRGQSHGSRAIAVPYAFLVRGQRGQVSKMSPLSPLVFFAGDARKPCPIEMSPLSPLSPHKKQYLKLVLLNIGYFFTNY
jgi:hypothetical protein